MTPRAPKPTLPAPEPETPANPVLQNWDDQPLLVPGGYGPIGMPTWNTLQKEPTAEEAEGRSERAALIGADIQGPHQPGRGVGVPETKPMSWEEYNALTDRQRAAVDFNTQLAGAVQRDIRMDRKARESGETPEITGPYAKVVNEMFGEDGGSTIKAPETVALLRQIMFEDQNADLDDFLNMNMAVTAGALTTLVPKTDKNPDGFEGSDTQKEIIKLSRDLAKQSDKMQKAVVTSQNLINSVGDTVAAQRYDAVRMLGGQPKKMKVELGYGNTSDDDAFRRTFDVLADKGQDPSGAGLLSKAQAYMGPEYWSKFVQYAESRIRASADYGIPLGQNEAVRYRTPDEYRVLLGLEEGAPR
jgi:hypothetical protein